MRSAESYKHPLYLCDDPKKTGEQCFSEFAEREHEGRKYTRTENGGYQFVDGVKVYRVTIYSRGNGSYVWGVYRDYDDEKTTTPEANE